MEPVTHQTNSNHLEWNESYYFTFFNKKHNIGGVSRIGFKPNKQEGMTFFFLFLPDGSAGGYHQVKKVKNYSKKLQVAGMSHNCRQDGKWSYNFRGYLAIVKNPEDLPRVRDKPNLINEMKPVEMHLEFDPINEVYEYSEYMSAESLELGKKAGDKHWEQIALIEGEIYIGEQELSIKDTIGQRDHTYGIRDWTGVGNWLYYVVWFNKNLAINPATIIGHDGSLSTGGFLFKEGKNIPLKTISITDQQFRKNGVFPISSELEIIDYESEKHNLKAKVGPIIPIEFIDSKGNKAILIQSFGDFELDGLKGGYGTFETLRRVKNI